MIHIALMINYIIRNQTKEIFDAWADAHWIPSIKPGEYFVSENNQINLILHGFKSEVIYLTKKISCVSIRNKENEVIKS